MSINKSSIVAIAAMVGSVPYAASQVSQADADTISQVILSEVAVVAQRADASTPVAYTNVKASDIAHANTGVDIPYLLALTPSVVNTSDAGAGIGYTSIRIRGTEGSRINVTANGIPVNDSESHNVYWVNLPDMASSLKDIQVQRGVGTSTNGAGAFGASINMATESPSPRPSASFCGSYGMYNTHKETFKASTGLINDRWSAEIRLSNIGTDGYIERAKADLWSYFGQIGYYDGPMSLRLIAFGGKERTYMAWDYASKEEMALYGRRYNPCGRYTDSDGNVAYYKDQYDNYSLHNIHLIFKHQLSTSLRMDAALHYTRGDGYYEQYKTKRTLVEYGLTPFEQITVADDGSVVTETIKKADLIRLKKMANDFGGALVNFNLNTGRVAAVAGASFNVYDGDHFGQVAWVRNYVGALNPLQEYYRNTGHKVDAAMYARASVDITGGLSGYADLQYRHIHYTIRGVSDTYDYSTNAPMGLNIHHDYSFFNPKLGVNWRINNSMRAYASWAVAHREPTRDNFVDADADRQPKAERLDDFEVGYSYGTGMLSLGVNLYYMNYKDQLVATGQLSDTGNAISENVPRSYRAGVEIQAGLKPCGWLDWQINATLSRNRIKNFVEYIYEDEWTNPITIDHGDTRIAFSPDFTLNNALNFNVGGFDASIQSHYVSRQYLSNAEIREQSLDGYFVTNLIVGYTFKPAGLKSLRVGLTVNNVFSEKYFDNGYAGAGYYVNGADKVIYRYAGFAAQAPVNVMGSISIEL